MAIPHPSLDGFDRRHRSGDRLWRAMFNTVALGAIVGAPVATVSLWLLLTDPVLAGEVADSGAVFPIARSLFVTVTRAVAALLAFL